MTMGIPVSTKETNMVRIIAFEINLQRQLIFIQYEFGHRDALGNEVVYSTDGFYLGQDKLMALLNATPPGNKMFKQWIRPLIYAEIASHLGVPVGDIS